MNQNYNDCIKINRPRRVLADPTHPDYAKYVLANNTTNPQTFQSFFNQPDMRDFSYSLERHAQYYTHHPMKGKIKDAPEFIFDSLSGRVIEYPNPERDLIEQYQGEKESIEESFEQILKRTNQLYDKTEIEEKVKEIEAKFEGINIPNKQAVIEQLTKEYIVNKFKRDLIGLDNDLMKTLAESTRTTSTTFQRLEEQVAQLVSGAQLSQTIEQEQAEKEEQLRNVRFGDDEPIDLLAGGVEESKEEGELQEEKDGEPLGAGAPAGGKSSRKGENTLFTVLKNYLEAVGINTDGINNTRNKDKLYQRFRTRINLSAENYNKFIQSLTPTLILSFNINQLDNDDKYEIQDITRQINLKALIATEEAFNRAGTIPGTTVSTTQRRAQSEQPRGRSRERKIKLPVQTTPTRGRGRGRGRGK